MEKKQIKTEILLPLIQQISKKGKKRIKKRSVGVRKKALL